MKIEGNIVDVLAGAIFPGAIVIKDGCILAVEKNTKKYSHYIVPGLVDAHVHVESSMLPPAEFARLACVHGTIAAVADPHEIANVLGMEGVRFMCDNGARLPFLFSFGAPSCVPATPFETSGGVINVTDIEKLLASDEVGYLSEVMNYPGVLQNDPVVMEKIAVAQKYSKPIDGHAPGLNDQALKQYCQAGISTDHECTTREEALAKIACGMKILIREGSAARDFDELAPLIESHPDRVMFCSDDKHPDDLVHGHINLLVARAIAKGMDPIKVLRCASLNPARHYKLPLGLLQIGDRADLLLVDALDSMRPLKTYIAGQLCAEAGTPLLSHKPVKTINRFAATPIVEADLGLAAKPGKLMVMEAMDGQLLTNSRQVPALVKNGFNVSDPDRDILKIVVINRYQPAPPALGFVKGFGLKSGAIASTVAHDSHNIIAVGVEDCAICRAVNLLIETGGGICAAGKNFAELLPLPIAGLMSADDGYRVAEAYTKLDLKAKELGSNLNSPFMTLSFMALLVIPALKLSDKGLFDSKAFRLVDNFAPQPEK